MGEVCYKASYV